jgi:multidrug resistance efflux pump
MLQVTSPKAWLALAALLVLLVTVVVWSLLGSVPTKVAAPVILLKTGGVKNVASTQAGQIERIYVSAGDTVAEGQVLATIAGLNGGEVSQVVSPYTGYVLEVRVDEGNLIDLGTPLLNLELVGEDIKLEAIMYVPATEGKNIEPGMEVQIAPSSVRQEEYGFMVGRVTSVGKFPSTYQGMLRILGSDELVQTFAGVGASIQVMVELVADSQTASGYQWSSADGPPVDLLSGTLGSANIVIGEQRPIEYVLP